MTKLCVLNVGPVEWFSPHFAFDDDDFIVSNYDPLKEKVSLYQRVDELKPDLLFVFRGDLLRGELNNLRHINKIEFSSEIYPTNVFSSNFAQNIAIRKFVHCLKNLSLTDKVFHYDESRRLFFDAMDLKLDFHFLPVNISCFGNASFYKKDIDVLFFGRASERRSGVLNGLKEVGLKFVWIENGLAWEELSKYILRSRFVINICAEDNDNFEPRILLGLAGGAHVITEQSVGLDLFLEKYPNYRSFIHVISPQTNEILKKVRELKNVDFCISNSDVYELSSNFFIKKWINGFV